VTHPAVNPVPPRPARCCCCPQRKETVLLYPGGVREGFKRKNEKYKLFWPSKAEFVRMVGTLGPGACVGGLGAAGHPGSCVGGVGAPDCVLACPAAQQQGGWKAGRLGHGSGGGGERESHRSPAMLPE
jgi:hypothetical protein